MAAYGIVTAEGADQTNNELGPSLTNRSALPRPGPYRGTLCNPPALDNEATRANKVPVFARYVDESRRNP